MKIKFNRKLNESKIDRAQFGDALEKLLVLLKKAGTENWSLDSRSVSIGERNFSKRISFLITPKDKNNNDMELPTLEIFYEPDDDGTIHIYTKENPDVVERSSADEDDLWSNTKSFIDIWYTDKKIRNKKESISKEKRFPMKEERTLDDIDADMLDDIDADMDDKKEMARQRWERRKNDARSDRDYRAKHNIRNRFKDLDSIDAEMDDEDEFAKSKYMRRKDDARADRDYWAKKDLHERYEDSDLYQDIVRVLTNYEEKNGDLYEEAMYDVLVDVQRYIDRGDLLFKSELEELDESKDIDNTQLSDEEFTKYLKRMVKGGENAPKHRMYTPEEFVKHFGDCKIK